MWAAQQSFLEETNKAKGIYLAEKNISLVSQWWKNRKLFQMDGRREKMYCKAFVRDLSLCVCLFLILWVFFTKLRNSKFYYSAFCNISESFVNMYASAFMCLWLCLLQRKQTDSQFNPIWLPIDKNSKKIYRYSGQFFVKREEMKHVLFFLIKKIKWKEIRSSNFLFLRHLFLSNTYKQCTFKQK